MPNPITPPRQNTTSTNVENQIRWRLSATRTSRRLQRRDSFAARRARARVDERFDPAKALAATARYLTLAKERFGREGEVSHLDGLSIAATDWHMNVRPSNTEPLLRLNLEARSRELMEAKRDEVLEVIRS